MNGGKYVIAGGGMVAGYAAKQLVDLGLASGELAILSADTALPYERPPLSKGFLAGKETEASIRISPEEFYRDHGINVKLGCQVEGLDAARKRLRLAAGEEFRFEQLILATGSQIRKLDVPGAGLANVQYLRSMDDSKAIRQRAQGVKQAVVIGSGFIGMEVAAVLAQKSIEVTMVVRDDRIWKPVFTPPMSNFFEGYYSARGVRFAKKAKVQELRGQGTVSSAVLDSGQDIVCQLVVAGIGVRPVTEWLAGSGIEVDDGVMVNEYLQTGTSGIYAAGDLANYQDVLFQKRRRVEHWDNAVSQGQYCARALTGEHTPFRHVPYFFSDVFDLSYEFWGDPSVSDRVIHRGDLSTSSFSVWWLRQSAVVAAFVMNCPNQEREVAPKWIESRQPVSAEALSNASQDILTVAA